jgi:formylglycine-generating enzyme required for sulfatase activity
VRAEATLGERKSALIPAMIEPCDRPILFELIQTADLTRWEGDHADADWQAFLADVRAHISATDSRATPEPATAPVAEPAANQDSVETAYWNSIKDGDDVEEFESYLKRFPSGHFADLARRHLQALKTPAPAAAAPAPAAAPRPAAAPAAAGTKKRPGGAMVPILVGLVLLVAAGGGGYYVLQRGATTATPVAAAAAAAPPVSEAAPTAESAAFRDCEDVCPEMARIPAGVFQMGAPDTEAGANSWEKPRHEVRVAAFAISANEITMAQWDACVADGGCGGYAPPDRGWGRGERPAIAISWDDANAYTAWLSRKTGRAYRLPSEAEWEYAARGGTQTAFWWGDAFDPGRIARGQTMPVGSFPANAFGLLDVSGNAREWVEDCYVNSYADALPDGRPYTAGNCALRVVRGGGWRSQQGEFRIANRARLPRNTRDATIGFRVASAP